MQLLNRFKNPAQKTATINDLAEGFNYRELLDDGQINSETKETFVKKEIIKFLRGNLINIELKRRQENLQEVVRSDINKIDLT